MKISIIMPAYNAADFIEEAIYSVLNQDYSDWELIIINDGSKDHTEDIVSQFRDQRIIYLKQENKGVSVARNHGLRYLTGELFCLLDADDTLTRKSLLSRVQLFESDPGIGFVDGIVRIYSETFKDFQSVWMPGIQECYPLDDLLNLNGRVFFGPSWLIRSSLLGDIQFNPGLTHGEELFFFMELAHRNPGFKYLNSNAEVLNYRKRTGSAMTNYHGLLTGYITMINLIKNHLRVRSSKKIRFKFMAAKAMFLSFMSGRFYKDAFNSIWKILTA